MTKFALLGTASALALTLALAQGASANEPWHGDDAGKTTTITKSYDNDDNSSTVINKSYSDNDDNSVRSDDDNTATNSFNYSNREDVRVNVALRKDETEVKADADEGSVAAVNGNAYDNSIGRGNSGSLAGGDLNNGQQTDISLGDVLVNLASANAGLHSASMNAAFKAGVETAGISQIELNSMHGIAQINANTGVASQASNIALNAVVK